MLLGLNAWRAETFSELFCLELSSCTLDKAASIPLRREHYHLNGPGDRELGRSRRGVGGEGSHPHHHKTADPPSMGELEGAGSKGGLW